MDEKLRELIATVCKRYPAGTREWKKAMHHLLIEIQSLQELAKDSHYNYEEVLNDTLLEVSQRICEFRLDSNELKNSLIVWINLKLRLKYKILDLYRYNDIFVTTKTRAEKIRISKQVENERDPRPCSLWEIEAETERRQEQEAVHSIGTKVQNYILQDPEGRLRNCSLRNYPDCNCQALSERLLLKAPPDKLAAVAREFGVSYQTLVSHWKKKGEPLIQKIATEITNSYTNQPPNLSRTYE